MSDSQWLLIPSQSFFSFLLLLFQFEFSLFKNKTKLEDNKMATSSAYPNKARISTLVWRLTYLDHGETESVDLILEKLLTPNCYEASRLRREITTDSWENTEVKEVSPKIKSRASSAGKISYITVSTQLINF